MPLLSPQITTITDFATTLTQSILASPIEQIFTLYQAYVEITGNELDYDAGLIGDNVLKSVYLQRNNREDQQSDVTLTIRDNHIIGTEKGIRDVYLSSPIRNRMIKSERNKGFVRSSDY